MLQASSLRVQIEVFTSQGSKLLSQAIVSGSQAFFSKAIQEFSTSYKYALLLNPRDGTEQLCAYNLGAAHIAGGDTLRGISLLLTVLEHANWPITEDKDSRLSYKADVFFNIASGYEKLSDVDLAIKYFTSALLHYDEESDAGKISETHLKIGNLHNSRNDYSESRRSFDLAARGYWKSGDAGNALLARTCQANAGVLDKTFSRDECEKLLNNCCKDCAELKNKSLQGKILCEVGLLYSKLGCIDRALLCFEKSIQLSNKSGNTQRRALALQNAGAILNAMGYYQESIPRHKQAAKLHGFLMNRNAQGQSFCNLGFARSQLSHYDEAWEAYLHALKAFEDTDDRQGMWQCHEGLGAIEFNSKRHEKAVEHFKMALACLTIGRDDDSRDRVIYKLEKALQLGGGESPKDNKNPLAIESYRQEARARTPSSAKARLMQDASNLQAVTPTKRLASHKKRRSLKGRRRVYSDENERPVHHIARGISNLTASSNPYANGHVHVISTDSDSSDSEDSKDSGGFFDGVLSFLPNSKDDRSDGEQKKTKSSMKRNHIRRIVETTTMPIHSLTAGQDKDESDRPSTSKSKDLVTADSARRASSTENIAQVYVKQLSHIDENEDDFTDVTDNSSSSKSSSSESSDEENHETRPQPSRDSEEKIRSGTYLTLNKGPDAQHTLSPPDPTVPMFQEHDSSHLYASINTTKKSINTTSAGSLDNSDYKVKEGDSGEDIPPLLAAHSPRSAASAKSGLPEIVVFGPPIYSSPPEDDPPPVPQNHPSSSSSRQRYEKPKQSRACVVM